MTTPIIICTRHPDYENEYESFGPPVVHIDIDYDGAYQVSEPDFADWASSHLRHAYELRKDCISAADYYESVILSAATEFKYGPNLDVNDINELRQWILSLDEDSQ